MPCVVPSLCCARTWEEVAASEDAVGSFLRSSRGVSQDELLAVPWGVAVLDEGHAIRNPDANVTLVAKQARLFDPAFDCSPAVRSAAERTAALAPASRPIPLLSTPPH